LLELLLELFIRQIIHQIRDPQFHRTVLGLVHQFHVINVIHEAVYIVKHDTVSGGWAIVPPVHMKDSVEFLDTRETTTRYVPWGASQATVLTLEIVKVGVVYETHFNATRVPVKGGVTTGTPHLGAPRNLENHGATLDTGLGVLFEEFNRLHRPWVTDVGGLRCLRRLDLIAFRANVIFAYITFPPS
jgi:hypothetical protein